MADLSSRGVSPVVAVILMVAVTVILSAVIGTFVLNIGQGLSEDGTQSVGVRTTSDGSNITAEVITGEADELRLLVNGTVVDTHTDVQPGDSVTGNASEKSTIVIIAVNQGDTTVVSTSNPLDDGSSSTVNSGPTAPTDGLIAYWKFDGDATDSAGSNDGTVYGATETDTSRGKVYKFDGADDYITFNSDPLNASTGSLAFWFKTTGSTESKAAGVVGNRGDLSSTWQVQVVQETTDEFIIAINGSSYTEISMGTYSGGVWHHGVITWNNSQTVLYTDGTQINSTTVTPSASGDSPFKSGVYYDSTNRYYTGHLDDVRVYNRSLSKNEVQDLYNATK